MSSTVHPEHPEVKPEISDFIRYPYPGAPVQAAIDAENAAWTRAEELIAELAVVVQPIWHQGDGYGGAVLEMLARYVAQARESRP
jgi:hypothetical protein